MLTNGVHFTCVRVEIMEDYLKNLASEKSKAEFTPSTKVERNL